MMFLKQFYFFDLFFFKYYFLCILRYSWNKIILLVYRIFGENFLIQMFKMGVVEEWVGNQKNYGLILGSLVINYVVKCFNFFILVDWKGQDILFDLQGWQMVIENIIREVF